MPRKHIAVTEVSGTILSEKYSCCVYRASYILPQYHFGVMHSSLAHLFIFPQDEGNDGQHETNIKSEDYI